MKRMNRMNRMLKLISIAFIAVALIFTVLHSASGSAKFTKETGKKCLDCHSKIPKKGETELYLTDYGKKFKENGNKAVQEKK